MQIKTLRFKKLLTVFLFLIAVMAAYFVLIKPSLVSAVSSCSDTCSGGQRRCSGSGYQVCGNYDSDYCYEWSSVMACSTNYKCQNGSCIKSCSDACSSGSKRCSGTSGYQTCVKGSSGCYVWGSTSNCSTNYKCQNGSCVKSCSDACSSGSKRCSGTNGYQTCVKGSSGCYVWGSANSCSTGYACQNGSCVRSCSDQCSSGSKQCSGTNGYQTCVKGNSGCYVWGSTSNCSTNYKCQNGSCIKSCSDACSSGAKQCSGTGAYQTCVKSSSGCFAWGSTSNCSTNYKCQNGSCVKSCSDACSSGSKRCSGANGYQTCVKGSSGCYVWGSANSCSTGYACQNGSCVRSCSDECTSGSKQCSGTNGYQTCVKGSSGCYVWGSANSCSTGYACQNGSCVRSCSDQCSSGSKQCSGTNGYQTCVKGSSGCYVWGSTSNCSTGYACQNGSCVRSCSDECTSGSKQCSGTNGYQTCVKGSSGCYVWGSTTNCNSGYACQNGSCVSSCSDECTNGDKECSGDASYRTCGNYDSDKCLEWGTAKSCTNGYVCQDGGCVRSCSDECTSGQKQCSGDSAYQTCAKNSQGCYVWGSTSNCSTGYACQNGSCVRSCSDECTSGSKQCSGTNGYQSCTKGSSGCYVWGSTTNCNSGYACQNGSCVNSCSDECSPGEKECSGDSGYRTCGKYDLDSCYEWSAVKNCSTDYACQDGGCVKGCSDQCTLGDHQCSGTSGRTCGNYGSNSCAGWSGYDKCDGQCYFCGDGKCNSDCGETKTNCSKDCGTDKPTVDLAGPGSVSCQGSATLTWTSTNAETCVASGGWSGTKETFGSETIDNIAANKTFTLKCTGLSGSASDSLATSVKSVNPSADAGDDLKIDESEDIRLDGSNSTSGSDDNDLTYAWTCNGGTLDNADTAQPTFFAPEISRDTVYTCTLKVTNNCNKIDSDTVNVVVKNIVAGQFSVNLSASPDNGCAPLNNVDLTAKVSDIQGDQDNEYTYYFSCEGDGNWDKTITTAATTYTARGLCDYETANDYSAKVKVEGSESGKEATDSVKIGANDCGQEFTVRLKTEPTGGCKPLNNVDLIATISNYDNTDNNSDEFTYRFDCDNDGNWDKTITTGNDTYTAKDLCDYKTAATHTAKVTVEINGNEASDTADVKVQSCASTEFNVDLTARPDNGCAPLSNVDLTAHITGYDNSSDAEYTYYFDCNDDGAWDKTIATTATTYTARGLCDYDNADNYTARVKVENSGRSDEDSLVINTDDCAGANGKIKVDKTVSNLSRGAGYFDSVDAKPGDFVNFKIVIEALSDNISELTLADILPKDLSSPRDIRIDGRTASNDLANGLALDDLNNGDTVTVSFTATVAKASEFSYGQTTITNTATARGKGTSDSDTADVVVQRAEVEGITTVSTGFTDNPFVDSFVIPAALALSLIWAFKAKLIKLEEWLDQKKRNYLVYKSRKSLDLQRAKLKAQRITDRFI